MAWALAEPAEIARRADDAVSKVVLPESVHHDAGRQGMPSNRLRQLQPATAALEKSRLAFARGSDKPPRDFFAEAVRAASEMDSQVRGLRRIGKSMEEGVGRRRSLLQGFEFGPQRIEIAFPLAAEEAVELFVLIDQDSAVSLRRVFVVILFGEEVSPEEKLVSLHRPDGGIATGAEIFVGDEPVGEMDKACVFGRLVQRQDDSVLLVNLFLLCEHREDYRLKIHRDLLHLIRRGIASQEIVPGFQVRMVFLGIGQILDRKS